MTLKESITYVGLLVGAGGAAGQGSSRAAAAPAGQTVTQPPEPIDPGPINGESYYLINQASGLQADLEGNAVVENMRSFTNLSQRWAMTKVADGHWLISNVGSHLVLDVPDSGAAAGAKLGQAPVAGEASPTQSWLLRPTYFLGNDSSLQEKTEADRVAANLPTAPWWHDGYVPGQDLLQIFKDQGMNMIRVRPVSINTTVVHDGVTFPITTAPYNSYTLAPPPRRCSARRCRVR